MSEVIEISVKLYISQHQVCDPRLHIYICYLYFSSCPVRAYKLLVKAAYLEHPKSMLMVSYSFLFGDKLPLNISGAHDLFIRLADFGDPRGQAVSIV